MKHSAALKRISQRDPADASASGTAAWSLETAARMRASFERGERRLAGWRASGVPVDDDAEAPSVNTLTKAMDALELVYVLAANHYARALHLRSITADADGDIYLDFSHESELISVVVPPHHPRIEWRHFDSERNLMNRRLVSERHLADLTTQQLVCNTSGSWYPSPSNPRQTAWSTDESPSAASTSTMMGLR